MTQQIYFWVYYLKELKTGSQTNTGLHMFIVGFNYSQNVNTTQMYVNG